MTRYEAIEARRVLRGAPDLTRPSPASPKRRNGPAFARTDYGVLRVHTDGKRFTIVRQRLTREDAEKAAGRARDAMTDAEVGDGWNYVARALGGRWKGKPPRNFQGRRER